MIRLNKLRYQTPILLQQVETLLEKDLLIGSVGDYVDHVETAGQQVDGEYNASTTNSLKDWYD